MKGYTNNPNGRPKKSATEKRKMVSFRLTPTVIDKIKKAAADFKVSQSDMLIRIVDESYLTYD